MTRRKYLLFFLIALLHSLLVLFFPTYSIYYFPLILFMWTLVCIAIIVVDLFDKTHLWKGAFYCLGMGVLSWMLGLYLQDMIFIP